MDNKLRLRDFLPSQLDEAGMTSQIMSYDYN